jgi:Centromere DNA-binding protein complex CBF3 subunit, domain 2
MVEAYLSHLPKKFLRRVAGFTSDEGGYFLPRAQAAPPPELLEKIWPWVEEWEERFRKRSLRKTWEEGGLDEDDVAGQGFLAVLRHLRVVLLQDLAVLQPDYPDLPFFQHEVFRMPSWASYSEVVRAAVLTPEYSRSLLLEQVLPEVSHAVYNTRDSLHHQAQHLHAALNIQLAALVKQMNNVAAIATSFSNLTSGGQLPLTIPLGTLPASPSLPPLSSLHLLLTSPTSQGTLLLAPRQPLTSVEPPLDRRLPTTRDWTQQQLSELLQRVKTDREWLPSYSYPSLTLCQQSRSSPLALRCPLRLRRQHGRQHFDCWRCTRWGTCGEPGRRAWGASRLWRPWRRPRGRTGGGRGG